MLNREDILLILKLMGEKTVVKPTKDFPYRVSCEGHGYSDDPKLGALQAKLSIMLEATKK